MIVFWILFSKFNQLPAAKKDSKNENPTKHLALILSGLWHSISYVNISFIADFFSAIWILVPFSIFRSEIRELFPKSFDRSFAWPVEMKMDDNFTRWDLELFSSSKHISPLLNRPQGCQECQKNRKCLRITTMIRYAANF